jgi:hypothetical protein
VWSAAFLALLPGTEENAARSGGREDQTLQSTHSRFTAIILPPLPLYLMECTPVTDDTGMKEREVQASGPIPIPMTMKMQL